MSAKRILVTGSTGFVGLRLVQKLTALGYDVVGFDTTDGDLANTKLEFTNLSHVFHLAARTFVPASWEETSDFYRVNVMGTVQVLELCRRNQCGLTYVSSYVYGPPAYLPVNEEHPIEAASPYNHSKLMAEEACKYYAKTFNIPVAVLRPVNIYGPGQNGQFLIPTILNQLFNNEIKTIEVMDLKPKRDFIFIDDFIGALVATLPNKHFNVFNLGSGHSVSVEEIITTSLHEAAMQKPYQSKNMERKNEVWDVYMDISKIRQELGWQPTVSFAEGIKKIISEQYKNNE